MAEPLRPMPAPALPSQVTLYQDDFARPKFTPRELEQIKDALGRSFTEIVADETSDDRLIVFAFLKLRRQGYAIEVGDFKDVLVEVAGGDREPVDPSSGEPSTS